MAGDVGASRLAGWAIGLESQAERDDKLDKEINRQRMCEMDDAKFKVGEVWAYNGFFNNPVTFEVINSHGNIRYKQLTGSTIDVIGGRTGYFDFDSTMYRESRKVPTEHKGEECT